jgi:hypothetical protein
MYNRVTSVIVVQNDIENEAAEKVKTSVSAGVKKVKRNEAVVIEEAKISISGFSNHHFYLFPT